MEGGLRVPGLACPTNHAELSLEPQCPVRSLPVPRIRSQGLCSLCSVCPRLTGLEDSAWGDEEETEHNYYNSVPGKEPPLGGLLDSRLALTQPCALGALSQVSPCGSRGEGHPWGFNPSSSFCSYSP